MNTRGIKTNEEIENIYLDTLNYLSKLIRRKHKAISIGKIKVNYLLILGFIRQIT